jgi:hypothetical protein
MTHKRDSVYTPKQDSIAIVKTLLSTHVPADLVHLVSDVTFHFRESWHETLPPIHEIRGWVSVAFQPETRFPSITLCENQCTIGTAEQYEEFNKTTDPSQKAVFERLMTGLMAVGQTLLKNKKVYKSMGFEMRLFSRWT